MTRLAIIAVLALCLAAATWWGWTQHEARNTALAERDEVRRQLTQARIAEAIASGLLDREEARSAELAEAVRQIYGGPDAALPDHIRALLDRGL